MSIFCEIKVTKPENEEFMPGDPVSGLIRYEVDEKIVFNKIIISLKGCGRLRVLDKQNNEQHVHTNKEEYVSIDNVVVDEEVSLGIGEYEAKFSFKLPENIPPTFMYQNNTIYCHIKCKIYYYIRIKFFTPDLLQLPISFKKGIIVGTAFVPSLPGKPAKYYKKKKIAKLTRGKNTIRIKAAIENSVIGDCEIVRFWYEIINDTHVEIKRVKLKLVEAYAFNATRLQRVKRFNNIKGIVSRTVAVKSGGTRKIFEIIMPFDKKTLQYSKIVTRYYFVKIKVILPLFRQNFALNIPIEVFNDIKESDRFELPRAYWEVMSDCAKSKDKVFSRDEKWTTDDEQYIYCDDICKIKF
ncbi:uncharacterized protein LOC131849532 [Achroia grisella]|uniref:uncharacterized protein LOC131849532 n=1 Tax=Achroia grisella TaxID=688607 RepID=UPI0027D20FAB|nr:uncharacterized protein LOC131849532 [Achroia grisella]